MSLKKLLGIISVIIIVVFSMMLTTSYAWYAFDNASTSFAGVTNNDDIIISYQKGEYISTNNAVPINSGDVSKYSEKNNFNIDVKKNVKDTEIAVTISLVDISIDGVLQHENFKIDLYYQGSYKTSVSGNGLGVSGATTKTLSTIVLDNDITNMFELRVYLLDDDTDQSAFMNATFSAKIQIDVVSRLNTSFKEYNDADIYVSSITIDGVVSDSLPTSGYYDMAAVCDKGSILKWDSISKTITYTTGSYVNDTCSLSFTSNSNPSYPLLSEMPVGSYVKYLGNNGCTGNQCRGQNANYVSDTSMGYCSESSYKFYVNGWRIAYKKDGSAYLISAGAPECMCSNSAGASSSSSCSSNLSLANISKHFDNLDAIALKYCNSKYSKGNVCNNTTAWAADAADFEAITGSELSSSSCNDGYGNMSCGYNNDLIDNGSYYWFATNYPDLNGVFRWNAKDRIVADFYSSNISGVRPILYLDPSVVATSGTGTYKDPYVISVNE